MSYESEERLMVQGFENDARRWPKYGEIPPTHDELVKIKQDKERLVKALNDIVHAGYEEADSSRACEFGAQSWNGKWWVQKFGCDSLQSCTDECEAVLFEAKIATNLLAKINELEQMLNNERTTERTIRRHKWQKELAEDAMVAMATTDVFGVIHQRPELRDYIEHWQPRGE